MNRIDRQVRVGKETVVGYFKVLHGLATGETK